jgi:hypothetical protein
LDSSKPPNDSGQETTMNFFNEYALLVAVAVPVLAIVGLNVFLWFGGERGTLLMPTPQDRLSLWNAAEAAAKGVTDETPARTGAAIVEPANDEDLRKAA